MSRILRFRVLGDLTIHCSACEQRVSNALRRLPGVEAVEASSRTQQVTVRTDAGRLDAHAVQARLELLGYRVALEAGAE